MAASERRILDQMTVQIPSSDVISVRATTGRGRTTTVTSAIKQSAILQKFLDERCFSLEIAEQAIAKTRSMTTTLAPDSVCYQRVGLAVEYGIRIRLGIFDFHSSLAQEGVRFLCNAASDEMAGPSLEFTQEVSDLILKANNNEKELARLSLLLARFDAIGRAGFTAIGNWNFANRDQMHQASQHEEEDVIRLVTDSLVVLQSSFGKPMYDHPIIGNEIIAAEGDFIIDGCLYDVKTTVNPCRRWEWRKHVQQLFTYSMLGSHRHPSFDRVAVLMPRQRTEFVWKLSQLTCGDPVVTKNQFQNTLLRLAITELGWSSQSAAKALGGC